jgi:hypothetical protein
VHRQTASEEEPDTPKKSRGWLLGLIFVVFAAVAVAIVYFTTVSD